ncbi:MAG: hypothetical protein Q9195_004143 [Heterodermia aff. obscurata]
MAKARKAEEKHKDSASLQISVEDFVRTRDSVGAVHSISSSFLSSRAPIPQRVTITTNNVNMAPLQLTIKFTNKTIAMPQPTHPMTRVQRDQAVQSVAFLTISMKNIIHLVFASINMVQTAPDGMPKPLTYIPQVVTGLATLQSAVQDLSRAYIAHTNTVIGKGPSAQPELLNFNPLGGEPLFGNRGMTPIPNVEAGESKKRKRAPHDKNAPKRPVTPYFLYMQTARSIIASEMPAGHTAKQVADEGTRRWLNMSEEEKKKWSYKYGVNFARYKEKSKAYKEGRPIPEITDEDAKKLYDEQIKSGKVKDEAPLDPGEDEGPEEEEEESNDESETSSSEEEPEPEPVKAPSPPPKSSRASKRHKGAISEKKPSPSKQIAVRVPEPVSTPAAVSIAKSPELEKKKKGSNKKDKGESITLRASSPPKLAISDSQQKPKRKKRKSEAAEK